MLDDLITLNDVLLLAPLDFCIEEILPATGICLIGGTPKDGKSIIVFDNILRGLQNQLAFGRFAQRFKKVLLVNVEGRHQGIKMREHMFKDLAPEALARVIVSGKPIRLTTPQGILAPRAFSTITETILKHEIDLVVLDPLVSFHSGDENNSMQMVGLLDELRTVAETAKCAFFIIHHTRKMGSMQTLEDAIDQGGNMLRGASGIFGAVDSLILLWRINDGKKRLLTFSCRYARGDTSAIEMQMDQLTWRMFPMREGVPDPIEWIAANGREDWDKYAKVFGLGAPQLETAKKIV